jgi:HTH-type transcriptional regulator/antitoxin HigA
MVRTNAKTAEEKKKIVHPGSRRNIESLTPAWRELAHRAPVKLGAIETDRHYRDMIDFMNTLIDSIGDRGNHPLIGLLDIVTIFIREYEARNIKLPDAPPASVLRLLMEQHDMRQTDLAKIFGSQSNVSEVLNGKREINARQARVLGKRFGVSPAVFI